MGRSRLLSVLTATVLSVGVLSLPAAAVELTGAVEDATRSTTAVAETATGTVSSNTAALPAGSEDTVSDTVADTVEPATDPVEDVAEAVGDAADQVVGTVEETLEDPLGKAEDVVDDPIGEVEDLLDPVTDDLPLPDTRERTRPAGDEGVAPASDPAPSSSQPSAGPGTSPSPSFDDMLTLPAMDHGISTSTRTSRPSAARVASPAGSSYDAVELAPEVAVQAAAPSGAGAPGVPGETVPVLLRALTAALVAAAMATWRTAQKQLAD